MYEAFYIGCTVALTGRLSPKLERAGITKGATIPTTTYATISLVPLAVALVNFDILPVK